MYEVFICTFILAGYLAFVTIKDKQIPASISDTFYMSGKWAFTLIMALCSLCMLTALLPISKPAFQFLAFFAGAGLMFVGAAPHFKQEFEKAVHFGGAYTFGVCSQVWIMLMASECHRDDLFSIVGLVWATALIGVILFTSKKTLIVELACVININIAVLILG